MMKSVTREFEMMNKLPFIVRCHMARYSKLTIDEFASISGMDEIEYRPVLRRVFNDLVHQGFAKKRNSGRHQRSRIYFSVPEKETDDVKKFAKIEETYYFDMDMKDFIKQNYMEKQVGL